MTPEQISIAFRNARLAATALPSYPGDTVPQSLDEAYRIQEIGISAWNDRVCGWKVAAIQPAWRETYPSERLAGPVFSKVLWSAGNEPSALPVIENGYAAVEAEFAIRIKDTIPADIRISEPSQLLPYVEGVYAAIELAASPLATLSALGPGAVISDFGNNSGVLVGPRLPDDLLAGPGDMATVTEINGDVVGTGNAARVPGGPLSALAFLIGQLATRGRSLNAGDWVSTGATTGIHQVRIGDAIKVSFSGEYQLSAVITAAEGSA